MWPRLIRPRDDMSVEIMVASTIVEMGDISSALFEVSSDGLSVIGGAGNTFPGLRDHHNYMQELEWLLPIKTI